MKWILDVNIRICHSAFDAFGQQIWTVYWDLETMVVYFVTQDLFLVVESLVKTN